MSHYVYFFRFHLSALLLSLKKIINDKMRFFPVLEYMGQRVGWLVIGLKSIVPLVGLGPIGGVHSVGVFLRDPSLYLGKFPKLFSAQCTIPFSLDKISSNVAR